MSETRTDKLRRFAKDAGITESGVLSDAMEDAADELDRLEAIVAKLPKTHDGVVAYPGMEIWTTFLANDAPDKMQIQRVALCDGKVGFDLDFDDGHDWVEPQWVYSTPEAAAESSARGDGGVG